MRMLLLGPFRVTALRGAGGFLRRYGFCCRCLGILRSDLVATFAARRNRWLGWLETVRRILLVQGPRDLADIGGCFVLQAKAVDVDSCLSIGRKLSFRFAEVLNLAS